MQGSVALWSALTAAASTFREICEMLQPRAPAAHHCNFLPSCPGRSSLRPHTWLVPWPWSSPTENRNLARPRLRREPAHHVPSEEVSLWLLLCGHSSVSICAMLMASSGPLAATRCAETYAKIQEVRLLDKKMVCWLLPIQSDAQLIQEWTWFLCSVQLCAEFWEE